MAVGGSGSGNKPKKEKKKKESEIMRDVAAWQEEEGRSDKNQT